MSEKQVQNVKQLGPFSNEMKPHRAIYDVAEDGGLTADTYTMMTAEKDMVVMIGNVDVKTAFAGGAGAGLKIGILGGDDDAMLAVTAVGSLTADAQLDVAASAKNLFLPAGSKLVVTPDTADLTAGKLEMVLYAHSR